MRPLIPRVYVGDVLKGTKNLRNWLRTVSLYTFLQAISNGQPAGPHNQLHTPTKEDKFLVVANAWNNFGVYGYNGGTVLLFSKPLAHKRKDEWMGPKTFSRWFIRTSERHADTSAWPTPAYYLRAALHFNLSGVSSRPNLPGLSFYSSGGYNSVFEMASNGHGFNKEDVNQVTRAWVVRGVTRSKPSGAPLKSWPGWGPKLEDLEDLKHAVRELCTNPRIARELKKNKQHASLVLESASYIYEY